MRKDAVLARDPSTDEVFEKTLLILLSMGIAAMEYFIPRIPLFPWLKPGLANIVTIYWLIRFGFVETILFSILRLWVVSFYFGFSFLTFSLGICGALSSIGVMYLCFHFLGKRRLMGSVGISICGALAHNIGQLACVYAMLASNAHIFLQVVPMLFASLVFGIFTGLLVIPLFRIMSSLHLLKSAEYLNVSLSGKVTGQSATNIFWGVFFFALCIVLLFVENAILLCLIGVAVTLIVQILFKGSFKALLAPLRQFYLLFFFVGVFHLLFTYGRYYANIPFITHEGVRATVIQWIKLWSWLQITAILTFFQFHLYFLKLLQRFFHGYSQTLFAGLTAVELFPDLPGLVMKSISGSMLKWILHPTILMDQIIRDIVELIERKQGDGSLVK